MPIAGQNATKQKPRKRDCLIHLRKGKKKFLDLNANKSFVARDRLKKLKSELTLDMISLKEPYVLDSTTRAPNGYLEMYLGEPSFRGDKAFEEHWKRGSLCKKQFAP